MSDDFITDLSGKILANAESFKEVETPVSKGIHAVLEVLKEHGMDDVEAQKIVFDMQKRGVDITFSQHMLDITRRFR